LVGDRRDLGLEEGADLQDLLVLAIGQLVLKEVEIALEQARGAGRVRNRHEPITYHRVWRLPTLPDNPLRLPPYGTSAPTFPGANVPYGGKPGGLSEGGTRRRELGTDGGEVV